MTVPADTADEQQLAEPDQDAPRSRRSWVAVVGGVYVYGGTAVALVVGTVLRVRVWAHGPSLWLDEISIAENIIARSPSQLVKPLGGNQSAPIGWLWSERFSIDRFGADERALRLVPVLAAVALLPAVVVLTAWVAGRWVVPVATALVALSPGLVDYADQAKQYSSDATVTVLVLLATVWALRGPPTWWRALVWGVACSALSWFAFPAVPITVLCGLVLAATWVRGLRSLLWTALAGLLLAVNLVVQDDVTLKALAKNTSLDRFWVSAGGYPASPTTPGVAAGWLHRVVGRVLEDPFRLEHWRTTVVLVALGAAALLVRRVPAGVVLLLPLLSGVALAVTHHYPLAIRLALYLVPPVLVLVAAGAVAVITTTVRLAATLPVPRPAVAVAGALVAVVALGGVGLVAGPSSRQAVDVLQHPPVVTAGRDAVQFIAEHRQPSDLVLDEHAFGAANLRFYGPRYGVTAQGTFLFQPYGCTGIDVTRLAGRRVWFLFSHRGAQEPRDRAALVAAQVGVHATRELHYDGAGQAAAYLFDFSQPPTDPAAPGPGCLSLSVAPGTLPA